MCIDEWRRVRDHDVHFGAPYDASIGAQRAPCNAVQGGGAIPREMAEMTNWETCPAVECTPGKVSGAWVFAGTRVPLSALYESLAGGATVDEFAAWFPGVDAQQVRSVLEHEARALRAAPTR